MSIEFGLFYDFDIQKGTTQSETFQRCFSQIEASERMGVDSIWLAEVHFSPFSVLSSPLIVASSVATRTSRVRIGLAVQVLPLANPLRVAQSRRSFFTSMASRGKPTTTSGTTPKPTPN